MKETNTISMMNFEDFKKVIMKKAEPVAGEGGTVDITHVIKNNGCEYDGLIILNKGSVISPTIYLNDYYEQYVNGKSIDSIFARIKELYYLNKDRLSVDTQSLMSFEGIKDKIVYKLINYNANRKLLSLVPHKKILDLAMVYYCILGEIEDGNATALIYNSNIKNWHIKEDELYRTAVSNTPKLLPVKIYEMSELIKYVDTAEGRYSLDDPWCSNLYVLTNKSRINGAAGIMYEGVLKKLADKLESDMYILPSSIHEVIILPKSTMFNKEELMAMVRDVNTEGVSKDEVLSYTVYEYDRNTEELYS